MRQDFHHHEFIRAGFYYSLRLAAEGQALAASLLARDSFAEFAC